MNVVQEITNFYHAESRRILATLIRLLHGNFELAEEAMQDAFTAALAQWPTQGIPDNPRAWLVSTGRFKAIDRLRKQTRQDQYLEALAQELEIEAQSQPQDQDIELEDDQLRMIFTCCHPSLSLEARVALTLREVCGLTTEAIAAAFLVPVPTLAQRIVRAKNKIRDARIPYEIPAAEALPARLHGVLPVIYLVFNEGYSASSGQQVTQQALSAEAIRLGRLLLDLLPNGEVMGLVALMLLHDARREGRTNANGDLIPLEHQDRSGWNQAQIKAGGELVSQALRSGPPGEYTLQAAIAALHAEAPSADATDWAEICGLYDLLQRWYPSSIVGLNRAVAIAMRDGPAAGLQAMDNLEDKKELQRFHLWHAAQADLYRRLDQWPEARHCYQQALALAQQEPERRFLQQRLDAIKNK